jgi:hypothetical protein
MREREWAESPPKNAPIPAHEPRLEKSFVHTGTALGNVDVLRLNAGKRVANKALGLSLVVY